MNRFKSNFYSIEKVVFRHGHHQYIQDEQGYLYSQAIHPTKIKPEDLPPWYIYGRYYKRFGYLSAKGVKDMVYRPSRFSNHYLKDDCLMVSYHGPITPHESEGVLLDHYTGWDERIWGGDMLAFIKGARDYSDYDITSLVEQLQQKADWMPTAFPEEFGDFTFDVHEYMNLKDKR